MPNGITFPNEGQANSVLVITNNRLKRFNENPQQIGSGEFADFNPDKEYSYLQENLTAAPSPDGSHAMVADENVNQDVQFLLYSDYPTNTVPRPANEGGYPTDRGDELRGKYDAGVLIVSIDPWIPPDGL